MMMIGDQEKLQINFIEFCNLEHHIDQNQCKLANSRVNLMIDQMQQHSFVDTDQMKLKTPNQLVNTYQISGQSFFARSNNLYYSQIGAQKIHKMKHKKMQCEIGSGIYCIENSKNNKTTLDKARRLQVLKIIKLVKSLFKFLRLSKHNIEKLVQEERERNAILYSTMKFQLKNILKNIWKAIEDKNKKIEDLSTENLRLCELHNSLLNKIEEDRSSGLNEMRQIYQQQQKKIVNLLKQQQIMHLKQEQLLQRNNQLENMIHNLEIELSNVQHSNQNNEVQLKKLQYQNHKLQQQAKQLAFKLQNILQFNQEHQNSQQQQDQLLLANYSKLKQIKTLNQLYIKEIQLTKKELWLTQQDYARLQIQKDQIVNSQLNKYQEYFKTELDKISKQMKQQIEKKDKIIEKMKQEEKIYIKIFLKHNISYQDISESSSTSSLDSAYLSKNYNFSTINSIQPLANSFSKNLKASKIENSPDKFLQTARSLEGKFSQSISNKSQRGFFLKNSKISKQGFDLIGRQYVTHNDGFRLKNDLKVANKQRFNEKDKHESERSELFNEKMTNIEHKLMKLNKSLDYRRTHPTSY